MITTNKIESYVGLTYDAETLDCADLAALIQKELFGKVIVLPGKRRRMVAPEQTFQRQGADYAHAITKEELRDGDAVIFKGDTMHIGTVFVLSGVAWVLHCSATIGHSVLHRLSDLSGLGLFVEGYYRWN
jgi:hypothetical protein